MELGGFSFCSKDIPKSLEIYHELFGWEVIHSGKKHGEMLILPYKPNGLLLYWSPIQGRCPVSPGTLTLKISLNEKTSLTEKTLWKDEFRLEYSDEERKYSSWLDQNSNRLWLYLN